MSMALRHCVAIAGGALVLAILLLTVGVPGTVLLGVALLVICLVTCLVIVVAAGHHDHAGERHAEMARHGGHHRTGP